MRNLKKEISELREIVDRLVWVEGKRIVGKVYLGHMDEYIVNMLQVDPPSQLHWIPLYQDSIIERRGDKVLIAIHRTGGGIIDKILIPAFNVIDYRDTYADAVEIIEEEYR